MVSWFRMWSRSIIVSVIISTVIEMILPENNSKKYIKIVIGMFIVYSIISPMINSFSNGGLDNIIENQEQYLQTSSSNYIIDNNISSKNNLSIKSIYSENLKKDMASKLKTMGYIAENIELTIANDDSYNIETVDIQIREIDPDSKNQKQAQGIVETVKYVIIKLDKQRQSESIINESDKNQIKNSISENYGVDFSKINVN